MDINGQTILSPGERSPFGQGSQFTGSKVGDDLLSWREIGCPVEIPQQSEESPLILEMRNREQQMRRQRDEALRALQQVIQAVGQAGSVGPNRVGHRASLTENMAQPYSFEIGPDLLEITLIIYLPQMT